MISTFTNRMRMAAFALLLWPVTGVADTIAVEWDNAALQAIRASHPGPPQVARMLAMTHTCMYDAWAAYDPVASGTRLGAKLRRPAVEATSANKRKAISYAAYRCLADLFPRQLSFLDKEMSRLGYDPGDNSKDPATPAGIGNTAAAEVIKACHRDGSNQLGDLEPGPYEDYTAYAPVNGPNRVNDPDHWQPLLVIDHGDMMVQRYVAPFWGRVHPFALASGDQFRPSPPYSEEQDPEQFVRQAQELIDISAHLTERQKVIAAYWADGPSSETPPGHWCLMAQFVSARDHHDVDADVKMFFALANALFDASIAAWDAKRAYDSVRPVTAIHYLFAGKKIHAWGGVGKGTEEMDGTAWRPYQETGVVTPPFPEYVSGHSTFSTAAAEVLKRFTGSDVFGGSAIIKAGSSKIEPGLVPAHDLTLSWGTFTEAAEEAGMSRRFGGIHFKHGDMMGRQLGRQVGAQAYARALNYFHGLAWTQ